MTSLPDPPRLTIRPAHGAGLFDVDCSGCGGTAVLEGDAPVLEQLAVFHLLHRGCPRTPVVAVPRQRQP